MGCDRHVGISFHDVSFPTLYSNLFWGRCLTHIGTEGSGGPFFAMTELKDASRAPKTKINRRAITAARKNVTR
jgi:hypothetical protein